MSRQGSVAPGGHFRYRDRAQTTALAGSGKMGTGRPFRSRRGGRAVECTGLENRHAPCGVSRVRIPPPPLDSPGTPVRELRAGDPARVRSARSRPPGPPGDHWRWRPAHPGPAGSHRGFGLPNPQPGQPWISCWKARLTATSSFSFSTVSQTHLDRNSSLGKASGSLAIGDPCFSRISWTPFTGEM